MRRIYIDVGGLTCPKKGSRKVMEALLKSIRRGHLEDEVEVIPRGCFGLCNIAPNLYVEPDGIWYSRFKVKDVPVIVRQHFRNNKPVGRLILYPTRWNSRRIKKGEHSMTEVLTAREVEVGDIAPDFSLKDENGNLVTLSSFRGQKRVVLAFYPFDWSPVCTTENCALSDDLAKFEDRGTVVFGVSADSHFSHKAWKEKLGFKHNFLSDLKREVCKKYGLYFEDLNCCKRATVVVDKAGKVAYKKVQEIKVPRNNSEILSSLR